MKQIGFDNAKYLETQSAHIKDRIAQFGDCLLYTSDAADE